MWVRFPPPPPSRPMPAWLAAVVLGLGAPVLRTSRSRSIPSAALSCGHRSSQALVLRTFALERRQLRESSDDRRRGFGLARPTTSSRCGSSRTRAIGAASAHGSTLRGRAAAGRAGRRPWRGAGIDTVELLVVAGSAHSGSTSRWACCGPASREFPGPRLQADARRLPFRDRRTCGHLGERVAAPPHRDRRGAGARRRPPDARGRADGCSVSVKRASGCETETARYGMPRFFQYWSGCRARRGARRRRVPTSSTAATGTSPRAEWLVRLAERID